MSVVAALRPDSLNFPLFVHVVGAMILVGGLLTGASCLAYARSDARFLRHGYWSLLVNSVPGWVLMRIGAQWISSKEGLDDLPEELEPRWLSIGGFIADVGGAILSCHLSWAASACTP